MELKIGYEELQRRLALPLSDKIDMACEKIEEYYNHYNGLVYLAFSGGKDSTVLLDIIRNKAFIPGKDVPAVFNNTGLEYPETVEFVKTFDNAVILRPKITFRQVIEKYGFAVVSKEQSGFIESYRSSKSERMKYIRKNGNERGFGKISKKWRFLLDAPFKISGKCCEHLKKRPSRIYEKETGRHGYLGIRAEESHIRTSLYMMNGCNAYDVKRPYSIPLAFFTEKDIYEYIDKYSIQLAKIYSMGYKRTGCMFCMFGVDQEQEPNRFQLMAETHPKQYKYSIENLGLGQVLDYINVEYKPLTKEQYEDKNKPKELKPKRITKPKMNARDNLITPKWLTQQLGHFDLDPCAAVDMPFHHADKEYTVEQDGLVQDWEGRVWLNPPLSDWKEFLAKLAAHGDGIAYVYTATDTKVFHDHVWNEADAVFFFKGRINMIKENRQPETSPPSGCCLVIYGKTNVEVVSKTNLPGKLVILKNA